MSPSKPISAAATAIVGGGPTGLLMAAVLSHHHPQASITVYDARTDPSVHDIHRAYSLVLYQPALRALRRVPALADAITDISLAQYVRIDHVLPPNPTAAPVVKSENIRDGPLHWLLRADMQTVLLRHLKQHCPNVTLRVGARVVDLNLPASATDTQAPALKLVDAASGDPLPDAPFDCLLACDGSDSAMRPLVARAERAQLLRSLNGLNVRERSIASHGVRHKGVTLSARPVISAAGRPVERAAPDTTYTLVGQRRGRPSENVFDAVILPAGHSAGTRRVLSVNFPEGHALEKIRDAEGMYKLFERNFPQVDVRDMIDTDAMAKFAQAEPGVFPNVSRPRSTVGWVAHTGADAGECVPILFAGDAAHAFPPDTAQGINSAAVEAGTLAQILAAGPASQSVADMAREFSAKRDCESDALSRMVVRGSAGKYGFFGLLHARYVAYRAVRGVAARLTLGLVKEHADVTVRETDSYARTLREERRSVGIVAVATLAAAVAVGSAVAKCGGEEE